MSFSLLKPISDRRLLASPLYHYRRIQFLALHPYCQVWLSEHNVAEDDAKRQQGLVRLPDQSLVAVPLATEIHHRNKRRGADLLDQSEWLAVCREYHERIERDKAWARAKGYLRDF